MKTTIRIEKEVDIKTLIVKAGVRYWEDAEVNGEKDTEDGEYIPCKVGQLWCPIIDVDSGIILNWAQGIKASIHYKVCDNGIYLMQDDQGFCVAKIEQDYVPKILCPKDRGYGDYIIMDIDANGKIADWEFTLDGFPEENEE